MNARRNILPGALLTAIMLVMLLVGCSSQQTDTQSAANTDEDQSSESEANSEEENAAYPIVIEHAFGETVIESKPERVATIQWGNHDVTLALGVVPVGFSAANYGVQDGDGLLPWTEEKLEELQVGEPNVFQDTDGLDFEAIADSNPDVILAAYSGITEEDYETLSKIAPVVAYPTTAWATTWREQILLNATGMGMEAEGEQLIQDLEKLIAEKLEDYPQIKGKKVVWVNFSADDLSEMHVYTPVDPRVAFLIKEIGLEYPESVTELIKDDTGYALGLSAENADVLFDADIIIGYGDEQLYQAVKDDPVLGKIPAIERGSIVSIGDGTPLAASANPNPLSITYTIDQYLELIGEAINKGND